MKCSRKASGVIRLDRLRKYDIRNRIAITPCIEYIEKRQIQWFEHLMGMEYNFLQVHRIKSCQVTEAEKDQETDY